MFVIVTNKLIDPCYFLSPVLIERTGLFFVLYPNGGVYDALIDKTEPITFKKIHERKGECFIDIGAGEGGYSILLSKNYKHTIAIEPDPIRFARLNVNIRINNLNVSTLRFYVSNFSKGSARTLDELVPKNIAVDLMKIDVDGPEFYVLLGAREVLLRTHSVIVEVRRNSLEQVLRLMWQLGFKHELTDLLIPDQGEMSFNLIFEKLNDYKGNSLMFEQG